ncbi:MAG: sigma-70 family RNA polymerase sigma factor [Myxococcota bacterium]
MTSSSPPDASIAALFDEHCGFVCRVLRHHGIDDATLDDAVQDVFVTAYRRWSSFEGRSSARTWLFGIARRVAARYRRSASTRARHLSTTAAAQASDGIDEPFARAQAAQSLDALLQGIDREKRSVFVLCEVEGMTAPEVAEALGLPVGTVYSRLRAAWQGLGREADREQRRLRRELTRTRPEPAPERRRRMWGLVSAGLTPLHAAPIATSASWLAQIKWAAIGGAVATGVLGARVAMVREAEPSPRPATVTAVAPSEPGRRPRSAPPPTRDPAPSIDPAAPVMTARPTPSRPAVARPDPAVPTPHAASTRAVRPSAPRPTETLNQELVLLRGAQQAIREGRGPAALELLERHARQFPRGQLAGERRTARINALCASGRPEDASREAEALGRDPATACSS